MLISLAATIIVVSCGHGGSSLVDRLWQIVSGKGTASKAASVPDPLKLRCVDGKSCNYGKLLQHKLNATKAKGEQPRSVWVHVAVRTYTAQNMHILGCLGSLYAAAQYAGPWLNLSVAVLNTGQDGASGQANIAKMLESFRATLRIGQGTLPPWVQQLGSLPVLRPQIAEPPDTYGYVASDNEIARHMKFVNEGRVTPNYILFCNGDTFYAQEVFLAARELMMQATGLIGMDWQPTVRHAPDGNIKRCKFRAGGLDLNGLLLHTHTLRNANASFGQLPIPCSEKGKRGCAKPNLRPYWMSDWSIAWQLIDHGASSVCLSTPRPLFLQN